MIMPRSILLWWCGGWLAPLSILAGIEPAQAGLLAALGGLLMLVPVFDALLSSRGAQGLDVALPRLLRLTKGAKGLLPVRIVNAGPSPQPARTIRLALALPAELGCAEFDLIVRLPAGSGHSTVSLACLPLQRGNFRVERCYVGTTSPLGFWLRRKTVATDAEVRVYPNLAGERKYLAALFLNRGGVGIHAQRQVGQGRDFEKLREYIQGDSYSEIHWKATAKRSRPVTKVFQVERTQEVYVVLDSSRLSGRATAAHGGALAETSLERFVSAAMILGLVAEKQGDLFGVVSYSDGVDRFVRARNGKEHYRSCREALHALQPSPVTPNFSELFSFIRLRLRRRALLIFLTDLDDPILAENLINAVPLVARQHLVLVNMIQPHGIGPVFSSPEARTTEDVYRDLAGHLRWQRLRGLEQMLQRQGVAFHLLPNAAFCPALVSQYMSVKRRQLL